MAVIYDFQSGNFEIYGVLGGTGVIFRIKFVTLNIGLSASYVGKSLCQSSLILSTLTSLKVRLSPGVILSSKQVFFPSREMALKPEARHETPSGYYGQER